MRRVTPFQRDFEDLHGRGSFRRRHATPEIVQHAPGRPPTTGALLVIGALGLFWSIVLSVVLVGMVIVAGVFVWALFTAPPL